VIANSLQAVSFLHSGTLLSTLLSRCESAFAAVSPLQKVLTLATGAVSLRIDPTADLVAAAFQSGKFRLKALNNDCFDIERLDDDGVLISDSWQQICRFSWDDTKGGALHVAGDLTVDGKITSPFWCAGKVNGATLETFSHGRVGFTIARVPTFNAGVFRTTFDSAHPSGDDFVVTTAAQFAGSATIWNNTSNLPTSTNFSVVTNGMTAGSLLNGIFYFTVLM
jgi:hypothetical protein